MKRPRTLEDYKAYAFGFSLMIAFALFPFAGTALLKYLFNL